MTMVTPAGPRFLLGACINESERGRVERSRHDVGGHVRNERNVPRLGKRRPLSPFDGIVGGNMKIRCIMIDREALWYVAEVPVLTGSDHLVSLLENLRFLDSFFAHDPVFT